MGITTRLAEGQWLTSLPPSYFLSGTLTCQRSGQCTRSRPSRYQGIQFPDSALTRIFRGSVSPHWNQIHCYGVKRPGPDIASTFLFCLRLDDSVLKVNHGKKPSTTSGHKSSTACDTRHTHKARHRGERTVHRWRAACSLDVSPKERRADFLTESLNAGGLNFCDRVIDLGDEAHLLRK